MDIFKWFRRKPSPAPVVVEPVAPSDQQGVRCSCCGAVVRAYNLYASGEIVCLPCVRKGHRHAAR